MIKHYNTEAEYESAVKSTTESQVSLVGADNEVHFDGTNVVVGARSAMTGSVVVLDANNAIHFIAYNTFKSANFATDWTIVGVVAVGVDHPKFRGRLVIVNKTNTSAEWSTAYSFKLTGYTLDGVSHEGTLNIWDASDNWAAVHPHVVTYTASTAEEMVAQLNTYFKANEPFTTQDWVASSDADGVITLTIHYIHWRQASDNGSAGFTLTANLLPELIANSMMLRYSGQRSGEGAIINWDRALAYFRADNASTSYNPSTDVTSTKRQYPICLPGYLGTSQYRSDHCALLRAHYGEGEEGWLKFMESCRAVNPSFYGALNDEIVGDGHRNTYILAPKMRTKQDGTQVPLSPAAQFCAGVEYSHDLFRAGKWHLPSIATLLDIVHGIHYGTNPDRKSDPLNAALAAIGGSPISNGSGVWSASRCSAGNAWCSSGNFGFASGGSMGGRNLAVPCVLLNVGEADS